MFCIKLSTDILMSNTEIEVYIIQYINLRLHDIVFINKQV